MELTTRNATLQDLAALLKEQQGRKLDMVVPAAKIESDSGVLIIEGADPVVEVDSDGIPSGVTPADGRYVPTAICDGGIAEKLTIPVQYLRRLREERIDLYDANVNGWLRGSSGSSGDDGYAPPDPRSFLLRCFRGEDGDGIARALLSNGFKIIDHLDVLTAALDGIRDAGVNVDVVGCDLTERKMYVRVAAPEIAVLAPTLLAGYRAPSFDGIRRDAWTNIDAIRNAARREGKDYPPGQEPIVFAGFEIGNSETGGGTAYFVPRLIVEMCKNGLKVQQDILKSVHLGSKMEDGIVRWSEDTQRKQLALITAQARDAVATFLDVNYVESVVERLEADAGTPIDHAQDVVTTVCNQLRFSEEHTAGVLDHFIQGGQMTAGGVLQAVTSFAQTINDADVAADFEAQGIRALELAAQA